MAKSAGNIARVGELLDGRRVGAGAALHAIAVHYRAPLNYSDDVAGRRGRRGRPARRGRRRARRRTARSGPTTPSCRACSTAARDAFGAALDDDLNVSAALAALFDLVRDLNRRIEGRTMSTADAGARPGGAAAISTRCSAILPDAAADLDA